MEAGSRGRRELEKRSNAGDISTTRNRPEDLLKRINSQGEKAKGKVREHKFINEGEKEEICKLIGAIQFRARCDLPLASRNFDFALPGSRAKALRRLIDNDAEIKQILQIAQKRDNGYAIKGYLRNAMREQVEQYFEMLIGSSSSEKIKINIARRNIADGLQMSTHDKIKVKVTKDVVKATLEFSEANRDLTRIRRGWHDWHAIVRDFADCRRTFAHNETKLTFEQVDDMRAIVMKAHTYLDKLMSRSQTSQGTLQEFADQQLATLDKTIGKASAAKAQIASCYLTALTAKMEATRDTIKCEVEGFKRDIETFPEDLRNADLKQLQTALRDFLRKQLDPKRAKQGAELFRKSYEQGSPEWREHLTSQKYQKEMQLMFIGQRAMTYHEPFLIKAHGGAYFFISSITVGDPGSARVYCFVPSTAKAIMSAYPTHFPGYDARRPTTSYLDKLAAPWPHFTFGWDNTPDAQRSYGQQGLLFMYPRGAVETFIKHTPARTRDFSAILAQDKTLRPEERELLQPFAVDTHMEGFTREEQISMNNEIREKYQKEISALVASKLPHLSAEDQKYIRECRICYRAFDIEYRYMASDQATIAEEQHIRDMIKVSGIPDFIASKAAKGDNA